MGSTDKNVKSELVLPPCKVCGQQASGYHYGVISCEACKIFFRRSLDIKHPYKCKKNDQCLILPNLRTPCSHCRLQKCLDLGMSKEGIKKGRYSCQKKTIARLEIEEFEEKVRKEKAEEVKKEQEQAKEMQSFVDRLVENDKKYHLFEPEFLRTVPEKHAKILEYVKAQEEVFGEMKPLPMQTYQDVYQATGIDVDGRRHLLETCGKSVAIEISTFVEFTKGLPGFSDIDIDDQLAIIRRHIWHWYTISGLPLFNSQHRLMTCPSCGVTFTEADFERFNDRTCPPLHNLTNFLKSLNFTSEELAVIKSMLIFYPDGCDKMFKDRNLIEERQMRCVDALQYLFEKNRSPSEISKLWGGISHYLTVSQGLFDRHNEPFWYGIFPDLDYPDFVWEIFGPVGKPRPRCNMNESSQTTFGDLTDMGEDLSVTDINETCDELCAAINLTL